MFKVECSDADLKLKDLHSMSSIHQKVSLTLTFPPPPKQDNDWAKSVATGIQ